MRRKWLCMAALVLALTAVPAATARADWTKIGTHTAYQKQDGTYATGLSLINGEIYYFTASGCMKTGWVRTGGVYYYFETTGERKGMAVRGWAELAGGKYYFLEDGRFIEGWIQKDGNLYYQVAGMGCLTGTQTIDDALYWFDENGVYRESVTQSLRSSGGLGKSSDLLFFTQFESGSAGYGQTGGDSGNACGKYQFDRRYSLIPFIKYCYAHDPVLFRKFRTYAKYANTTEYQELLRGNEEFYAAWRYIYKRYPTAFAYYQDRFAYEQYYETAEKLLRSAGLDISERPYVVRGAVFSYAIQHGARTAATAVIKAKITAETGNEEFITKLYRYRWKNKNAWAKNAVYKNRYRTERNTALAILAAL